tara:strand:+ start:521 stop:877 length:357 start_codon:yes stop_codon:yes gene_type:complete
MNAHYASMLEADLGARMLKSVMAETKPEPVFRGKGSNRKYITDDKLEARREMLTDALKLLGRATANELSVDLKSNVIETYNDLIRLCNDGVVERGKSRLELGHMRYVYWVADCNDGAK